MKKGLVIVESPAKRGPLGRILGSGYTVKASLGHVRDLPTSRMGVDVNDRVTPEYLVPYDRRKLVAEVREMAREAPATFLATDPDREGEAISWHLARAAEVPSERVRRVVFHEITRDAVLHAFETPAASTWTWSTPSRRGASWTAWWATTSARSSAASCGGGALRRARAVRRAAARRRARGGDRGVSPAGVLVHRGGPAPHGGQGRQGRRGRLRRRAGGHRRAQGAADRRVGGRGRHHHRRPAGRDLDRRRQEGAATRQRPAPPFITSTLQQEAFRKLRYGAKRTMMVAQQLYEGVSLGRGGPEGLITYMRTDSTNVAVSAVQERARTSGASSAPSTSRRSRGRIARGPRRPRRPTRPSVPRPSCGSPARSSSTSPRAAPPLRAGVAAFRRLADARRPGRGHQRPGARRQRPIGHGVPLPGKRLGRHVPRLQATLPGEHRRPRRRQGHPHVAAGVGRRRFGLPWYGLGAALHPASPPLQRSLAGRRPGGKGGGAAQYLRSHRLDGPAARLRAEGGRATSPTAPGAWSTTC